MRRAMLIVVTVLAVAALAAAPAQAQNCTRFLTGVGGAPQDFLCEVKSDFGTQFLDCFSFIQIGPDSLSFNVLGLSPFFTLANCDDDGSFFNPRFGRNTTWAGTFGPVTGTGPFGISFRGNSRRSPRPHLFDGRVHQEFGNRFVFRCNRDRTNVCPVLRAQGRPAENPWLGPTD